MLEILGRLIGSLVPSIIGAITKRPKLKILCGVCSEVNADGVGVFLAMWVKIINPTSTAVYFERLEAVDHAGEVFFPSVFRIKPGNEIPPQRNIVGIIPCGHITSTQPKALYVYDSTERRYEVQGRTLKRVVAELTAERARLESHNLSVHPTSPHPD
jgi:hypothetical protein